ncbi:MAG: sigma-70 family RNA polymerase sigma factor [bacterium]
MAQFNFATDAALWCAASAGDPQAEEELIRRYAHLVKICSRPLFLAGGDAEDLTQEGMLGLLSAVRTYSPEREASFGTYAEVCIRNRLYKAVRDAERLKNKPLNESLPIEDELLRAEERTLEERVATQDLLRRVFDSFSRKLTGMEKNVLDLFLEGQSYKQIAHTLGISPKSVDNAVQRIRRKLLNELSTSSGESATDRS